MARATEKRVGGGAGPGGFTLVELLMVVTIVALLVALLVPGMSAAWQTAHMTHCKSNLNTIWKAHGVWRSENQGEILNGGSWIGKLLPYVEFKMEVFQCQARASLLGGMGTYGAPGGSDGSGEGGDSGATTLGGFEGDSPDYDDPGWDDSSAEADAAFEFYIYWQQGSHGDTMGDTGIRADLAYVVPLEGHPWVRRYDYGDKILYEVDDEGSTGGANKLPTYDDMKFYIHYQDGQPTKIEILQQPDKSSPYKKYQYDFLVNGEVFISNWIQHIGKTYEFTWEQLNDGQAGGLGTDGGWGAAGGLSGATGWRWDGQDWVRVRQYLVVLGDYALSRGTYERRDASLVTGIDPKLFFILDFGFSKPVADFNMGGNTEDVWDQYFITDVEKWQKDFPDLAAKGWQRFQSLRHFGQSNVLFCDGHIESLGPEDLYYGNPLWTYQGR